jgi:hypothetical protein
MKAGHVDVTDAEVKTALAWLEEEHGLCVRMPIPRRGSGKERTNLEVSSFLTATGSKGWTC